MGNDAVISKVLERKNKAIKLKQNELPLQEIISNKNQNESKTDKPEFSHPLTVPDEATIRAQLKVWNYLLDHYFRSEMEGWEKLPDQPSMLVGVHSGTWLTMDALIFTL